MDIVLVDKLPATCSSPLASATYAPPLSIVGLVLFCVLLAWTWWRQVASLRKQLAQKDAELKKKDDKLKQKEAELRQKEADLEQKDARINDLIREIEEERALAVRTTARLNEMMADAVYELIGHFVLDPRHNRSGNARRLVMVQGLVQNDWNGFQGRYKDALLNSGEAMPSAQRFADSTPAERADYWKLYKARWFNEVNEYSKLYQHAVPHIGEEEMENENGAP